MRQILKLLAFITLITIGINNHALSQEVKTYSNPIFPHDFPDPTIVRGKDGYFYAYSTQNRIQGKRYYIPIIRSKNLVDWEIVGQALTKRPSWKKDGGGLWAPGVTPFKNKYYMFYSYSLWGDKNAAIGLAIADKPEGPFTDKGKFLDSESSGVYNSIDPFFIHDNGKNYLFWGSFHGIYAIELSADALSITGKKIPIADRQYEASYVLKRNGYYYYFGSVGSCCEGLKSTYHVKVGRSKNITGPYVDKNGVDLMNKGGTLFLKEDKDKTFVGTGHNAEIITDKNKTDWFIYHAYSKESPSSGRMMLMDKIIWKDGWPTIKDNRAGIGKQEAPVF